MTRRAFLVGVGCLVAGNAYAQRVRLRFVASTTGSNFIDDNSVTQWVDDSGATNFTDDTGA